MTDMLSDFVTLYTYKKSRRHADIQYPYGYGTFLPQPDLLLLSVNYF